MLGVNATSWQWIALSAALLGALALALTVPVGVGFHFGHRGETQLWLLFRIGSIKARVALLRSHATTNVTRDVPPNQNDRKRVEQAVPFIDRAARMIRLAEKAYRITRPAFRTIERLEWRTELGTGDAAATSLLAGALWAFKSTVVGVLYRHHTFLEAPRLMVAPDYDRERLALEIRCIFRLRLGDIILAAIEHLGHPKGSDLAWKRRGIRSKA